MNYSSDKRKDKRLSQWVQNQGVGERVGDIGNDVASDITTISKIFIGVATFVIGVSVIGGVNLWSSHQQLSTRTDALEYRLNASESQCRDTREDLDTLNARFEGHVGWGEGWVINAERRLDRLEGYRQNNNHQ